MKPRRPWESAATLVLP